MQQVALQDPYYNILAPQVAGDLSTAEYDGLFHILRSSIRVTRPVITLRRRRRICRCIRRQIDAAAMWAALAAASAVAAAAATAQSALTPNRLLDLS